MTQVAEPGNPWVATDPPNGQTAAMLLGSTARAIGSWFGVVPPPNPPPVRPTPQDPERSIPDGARPPEGVYTDLPVMSLGGWGVARTWT